MSVTANACPACSAPVPYGRLSCPACGELLAAVAGLPRRTAVPSTDSAPPGDVAAVGPAAEPEAEPSAALDPEPMALAAAETAASPEAGWSAAVEHAPTAPPADLVATDPDDHPAALAAAAPAPSSIVLARADAEDDDVPLLDPEPEAYPVRPAAFVAASTAPATPRVRSPRRRPASTSRRPSWRRSRGPCRSRRRASTHPGRRSRPRVPCPPAADPPPGGAHPSRCRRFGWGSSPSSSSSPEPAWPPSRSRSRGAAR